jgi:heat shock protein HslJ
VVRTAWLLAASLVLVGCGGPVGGPSAASDDGAPVLSDGTWVLVGGEVDGEPLAAPQGHRITLRVTGDEAGGSAACNQYGAAVSGRGDEVRIRLTGTTAMGCEPVVMAAEERFHAALPRITRASRDEHRLTLTGPATSLTFQRSDPVAIEELVGTTWVLERLLDGGEAAIPAGDEATLWLGADGTLRGSTGCRNLTGDYVMAGDEVRFTTFAADGDCPGELAEQDGLVVTVLGDGFRAELDDGVLTVASDGDLALVYRAR